MLTKPCATCTSPCYPLERIMISDLWVHKQGCLKCSVCSTTLSLSSVYVAASPAPPFQRMLFCSKDVPKIVHTNIVDSLALKNAMNAPKVADVPQGIMSPKRNKGSTKTIRFKGLTLRSKSITAGLNAPKVGVAGLMKSRAIVGTAGGGVPMDSWDIVHAMSVQNQVSAPIRDHPAIHAQRTGSSAGQWPMPSQPLQPQDTGASGISEIASANSGDEGMKIEPDLVKNLIKVFQLDALEAVEITHPPEPLIATIPDLLTPPDSAPNSPSPSDLADDETTSNYQGSIKPSTFFNLNDTYRYKTLATLGSRNTCRGTLTLAHMRGTIKRPNLSSLFVPDNNSSYGVDDDSMITPVGSEGCTPSPPNTPMPIRTFKPARQPITPNSEDDAAGGGGDMSVYSTPTGGVNASRNPKSPSLTIGRNGKNKGTAVKEEDSRESKGVQLLQALLPLAAHLIPLPSDGYDGDLEDGDEDDMETARQELIKELEEEGLELIMLFEEEPQPAIPA